MNLIGNIAIRQARNIVTAGALMIASSIANSSVRAFTNDTLESITRDIRRVKNGLKERRQEQ